MEWDFAANAVLDDVSKAPEGYRGLYVKGEGENANKFVIGGFAKGIVEAYSGTSRALADTAKAKKTASDEAAARRQALKTYEEFVTGLGLTVEGDKHFDALKSHVGDLTGKVKNGQEVNVNLEKIRNEHTTRVTEIEKVAGEKVTKMQNSLERYLVGEAATAALAASKGSIDLLLPHVKSRCKVIQDGEEFVVRVVDDKGDVRSNGKGGMMTVADLVAEMKTKDSFSRAFESEAKAGNGTKPGASQRQAPPQKSGEMTSSEKIAAGLAARAGGAR